MQVSARVTVTPQNLELPKTLEELIARGFHTVGFSPMLSSPSATLEMSRGDLGVMLEQMIACGGTFEEAILKGARYPFSNMMTAMRIRCSGIRVKRKQPSTIFGPGNARGSRNIARRRHNFIRAFAIDSIRPFGEIDR